jgi:hypothetical protein
MCSGFGVGGPVCDCSTPRLRSRPPGPMLDWAAVPHCRATLEWTCVAPVSAYQMFLRDCSTRLPKCRVDLSHRTDAWYLNRATTARATTAQNLGRQLRSTHPAGFEAVLVSATRSDKRMNHPNPLKSLESMYTSSVRWHIFVTTLHDVIA